MRIEKLEDIDQLFKQGLDKLPVDYNEGSWEQINSMLDAKPTNTLTNKTIGLKKIIAIIAITTAIVGTVAYFVFRKPQENQLHQIEQFIDHDSLIKSDSVAPVKNNDINSSEKTITPTIKKAEEIKMGKTDSIKSISKKDSVADDDKHIIW